MVMLKVIIITPAPSLIIFVTELQYDVRMVAFTAAILFCTTETEISALNIVYEILFATCTVDSWYVTPTMY